ncbi:MAG: Alpha-D-ribose 1-methylphosphonate 5-triphosphate diphosphatase [Gammaproteobacteria bacterium]|nr:MAG: Alpha-D-ribose 1-methylphosphonate 5-triphosphate diphosphatase [Gammaproteobacteria bacterium]
MTQSLCFVNARVVLENSVEDTTVQIEDGRIVGIGMAVNGREHDCGGCYLMPGIIDLHTDNLEKHYFPRPEINWHPVSASIVHDGLCSAVGVTTAFDAITIGSYWAKESRMEDNLRRLITGMEQAIEHDLLKADHRLHLRCEVTADDLGRMLDEFEDSPAVGMLSMMDHTPGQRQYPNLQKYLDRWADEGMSPDEIDGHLTFLRGRQDKLCPANRKRVAAAASRLAIPLASHDDAEYDHISEATSLGANIAEFPTTLEAARRAKEAGLSVVMGAPNLVRGGSYSGNVSTASVAKAGYLDVIASDYVPRGLIESAFMLTKEPFYWPIHEAIKTVTKSPARAVNLNDRGLIKQGLRADVVQVDTYDTWPLVKSVWVAGERVA